MQKEDSSAFKCKRRSSSLLFSSPVKFLLSLPIPGWERSTSDSRVLHDAVTRPNGLRVPTDGCYTNGEGFLASYRGTRYHLSEWGDGNMLRDHVEYFNMKHSKARNVI
ncbi:hypothetical protein ACLB2K_059637 [Fragaria x ananassa]